MRHKLTAVLFIITLALFIPIAAAGCKARPLNKRGYLTVTPKTPGERYIQTDTAEALNEKIMLTYETASQKTVSALRMSKTVNLIAANYTYPYVLNRVMTSGAFFTKKAQDNRAREAVLNGKAAFDIFGTLDAAGNELYIENLPYTVCGVIDDRDTGNLNVYIPARTSREVMAQSMSVSLDGVSEEFVRNELKTAGIDGARFNFLNLSQVSSLVTDKIYLCAVLAFAAILAAALKKAVKLLLKARKDFKLVRRAEYMPRALFDKSGSAFKLAGLASCLALIAVLVFLSAGFVTGKLLVIYSNRGVFNGIQMTILAPEAETLHGLYLASNILSVIFTAALTGFAALTASGD